MKYYFLIFLTIICIQNLISQDNYWQQQANYSIKAELFDKKNTIEGKESIEYYNNSDDTLKRLFFHIYWNSLKKNSEASQWVKETGDFMTDEKIFQLKPNEEGSQIVKNIKVDGREVKTIIHESILEVELSFPIPPHSVSNIELDFEAQIPISIRRSGRDNPAGTDFSICQWYPKICRYDHYGWHADPYIGREFAGTFGKFDVSLLLDKKYTVAGTGILKNKKYLEKGFEDLVQENVKDKKTLWHFEAENVHDFAWACDDNFYHQEKIVDGISFHFFYNNKEPYTEKWNEVVQVIDKAYQIAKDNFGPYPYSQFSFIQAGEGYMEYPMCTFLEKGSDEGFMSTAFHEFMHSWFYGIFGTDENLYHWMDEGMTSYAGTRLYYGINPVEGNINFETISGYDDYRNYCVEEPASTHANYFKNSESYILAAYYKGQLFVEQLRYIIGEENVKKGFHLYYNRWKFKHPEPHDFVNCMEDVSGIELSWYENYWLNTTKVIDYSIGEIKKENKFISISLKKSGGIPMPVDVEIIFSDNTKKLYYIPLDLMYGKKPHDYSVYPYERIILPDWSFAVNTYNFKINHDKEISSIKIDPFHYTADVNYMNNKIKF